MVMCANCRGRLDPATGRHIDEDGQVMDYREDLIHCRPDPEPGSEARRPEHLRRLVGNEKTGLEGPRAYYSGYCVSFN